MRAVLRQLTYANVIATLALFLALSGGVVWAAGKVSSGRLKPNSVSAGKIKRNAVTAAKIRSNAVTAAKIRPGAVDFAKLAAGINVIASAHGGPVPATDNSVIEVPLTGTVSFTPVAGTLDILNVEGKGENFGPVGGETCAVNFLPFVNGSLWLPADAIQLRAFPATPVEPSGLVPLVGVDGPIGLASPGVTQTVAVKVLGDSSCAPGSTVSVAIAVTQEK